MWVRLKPVICDDCPRKSRRRPVGSVVSGLHCSMPNGASAPGNVSTWPTTAPPAPVPMNGFTRLAGSLTAAAAWLPGAAVVPAWATPACAAVPVASASAMLAPVAVTASRRLIRRLIGRDMGGPL